MFGNTCDECSFYRIYDGMCNKHNILRHSCGEDACDDFILATDLAKDAAMCNETVKIINK